MMKPILLRSLFAFGGLLFLSTTIASAQPRATKVVAREIDRLLEKQLQQVKLPLSARSDDHVFLRRLSLDLTGRLPTPEQARAFLDSNDSEKRTKLLDALLQRTEYGRRFASYWTELFSKRNDFKSPNPVAFESWLADQFNQGKGWDDIVRRMVTAKGTAPETFFLMTNVERDVSPSRATGSIGALFLGQQLQCAECHAHPTVAAWKREDFWGMAAFFSRTRLEKKQAGQQGRPIEDVAESPLEKGPKVDPKTPKDKRPERKPLPPGTLEIPDANDNDLVVGVALAKYLEGAKAELDHKQPYRAPLAAWLTAPSNPYFARAAVNRVWGYFFARGFVNPLDDMKLGNEPSHPEVLELLTKEFIASGHDYRFLIRCICSTDAYHRSSKAVAGNENDQTLFSHMPVRVIQGPDLLDLYDQVLGKPKGPQEKSSKGKKGAVALDKLSTRDLLATAAYDERPDEYTFGIPQALRLMNRYLPQRQQPLVRMLASSGRTAEANIEHLYLLFLSRRPTAAESARARTFLESEGSAARGYEGLVWVLLNSPEFVSVP